MPVVIKQSLLVCLSLIIIRSSLGVEVNLCGDEQKQVTCPEKQVLSFTRVFYGVNTNAAVQCGTTDVTSCHLDNAIDDVISNLWGKTDGVLSAAIFKYDPCPGARKLLVVDYSCVALEGCDMTKAIVPENARMLSEDSQQVVFGCEISYMLSQTQGILRCDDGVWRSNGAICTRSSTGQLTTKYTTTTTTTSTTTTLTAAIVISSQASVPVVSPDIPPSVAITLSNTTTMTSRTSVLSETVTPVIRKTENMTSLTLDVMSQSPGVLAGIISGVVLFVIIALTVIILVIKRRKDGNHRRSKTIIHGLSYPENGDVMHDQAARTASPAIVRETPVLELTSSPQRRTLADILPEWYDSTKTPPNDSEIATSLDGVSTSSFTNPLADQDSLLSLPYVYRNDVTRPSVIKTHNRTSFVSSYDGDSEQTLYN